MGFRRCRAQLLHSPAQAGPGASDRGLSGHARARAIGRVLERLQDQVRADRAQRQRILLAVGDHGDAARKTRGTHRLDDGSPQILMAQPGLMDRQSRDDPRSG